MGARAILTEMRDLLKAQVDAIVAGDHQQVLAGALHHEQLLRDLENAEMDLTAAELTALVAEIDPLKVKLRSLLQTESQKNDFLLRLLLGGGHAKPGGYPEGIGRKQGGPRRLNHRT